MDDVLPELNDATVEVVSRTTHASERGRRAAGRGRRRPVVKFVNKVLLRRDQARSPTCTGSLREELPDRFRIAA